MKYIQTFLTLAATALILVGCQEQQPPSAEEAITAETQTSSTEEAPATTEGSPPPPTEDRPPPTPPLKEDFQGEPRISLFPRVGDFQPPLDDETHSYWRTFIEHLVKITRVVENKGDGNRGWAFRSIDSIDSVGYYAPVAVEPETDYQVTFEMTADLPEGASAGVGILEFDEFFLEAICQLQKVNIGSLVLVPAHKSVQAVNDYVGAVRKVAVHRVEYVDELAGVEFLEHA